jgi:hypothetical protein
MFRRPSYGLGFPSLKIGAFSGQTGYQMTKGQNFLWLPEPLDFRDRNVLGQFIIISFWSKKSENHHDKTRRVFVKELQDFQAKAIGKADQESVSLRLHFFFDQVKLGFIMFNEFSNQFLWQPWSPPCLRPGSIFPKLTC